MTPVFSYAGCGESQRPGGDLPRDSWPRRLLSSTVFSVRSEAPPIGHLPPLHALQDTLTITQQCIFLLLGHSRHCLVFSRTMLSLLIRQCAVMPGANGSPWRRCFISSSSHFHESIHSPRKTIKHLGKTGHGIACLFLAYDISYIEAIYALPTGWLSWSEKYFMKKMAKKPRGLRRQTVLHKWWKWKYMPLFIWCWQGVWQQLLCADMYIAIEKEV